MADSVTRDYWSRYFGDYGKIWVKDIPIKIKAALVASDSDLAKQAQMFSLFRKKDSGKPKFFGVQEEGTSTTYWFRAVGIRTKSIPFLFRAKPETRVKLLTIEPKADIDFAAAADLLGERVAVPPGDQLAVITNGIDRSSWDVVDETALTVHYDGYDQRKWMQPSKPQPPSDQAIWMQRTKSSARSTPSSDMTEPSDRYAAIAMEPLGYRKAENDGLVVEAMARVGEKLIPVTATFDAQGTLIAFVRGAA